MRGGHGYGKFYLSEVDRIEREHAAQLPPGGYNSAQMEAGFDKLAKSFGFSHTLRYLEEITPFKRSELLEWSIGEFKYELRYWAWKNHTEKKYSEILSRDNKKK